MKTNVSQLASVLILLILIACNKGEQDVMIETAVPTPPGTAIPFEMVETDEWGTDAQDVKKPKLAVLLGKEDIPDVSMHVSPEATTKLQQIDYHEQTVVVVWQGEEPTSEHGVEIQHMTQIDNELQIMAIFHEPEEGTVVLEAVTYPYQIVQFSKSDSNPIKQYVVLVEGTEILTYSPSETDIVPLPTSTRGE